MLIWFSQDARAYSLVFLLTALSFLFFARALRRRGERTLTRRGRSARRWRSRTHYFAGFVVVPEAALLLLWAERAATGRGDRCA